MRKIEEYQNEILRILSEEGAPLSVPQIFGFARIQVSCPALSLAMNQLHADGVVCYEPGKGWALVAEGETNEV